MSVQSARKTSDLAKARFALMFKNGSLPHEIARSLQESRKKLIAAKAKADNLPKKPEQEIQFLASFSGPAMDIIRKWFRSNADFSEELGFADALEQLEKSRGIIEDDLKKNAIWRQILKSFVSEDCPGAVTAFLSGIDAHEVQTSKIDAESVKNINAEELNKDVNPSSIASNVDQSDSINSLENSINIESNNNRSGRVERNLKLPIHKSRETSDKNLIGGLNIRNALAFKDTNIQDPNQCRFLGSVKRILPTGQIFVRVEGLWHDENIVEVTLDQAKKFFPINGDATAFPGTLRRTHFEGELGIWTAQLGHGPIGRSSHYVIHDPPTRVFEIFNIPHASDEPNRIRYWIQNNFKPRIPTTPIFLLSDNLMLRLPGDPIDPSQYNFENPLDGYWKLDAIRRSNGQIFVVVPLLAPDIKYDCAPEAVLLKKIVRQYGLAVGFPAFTKTQVLQLVDYIESTQDDSYLLSLPRVKELLLSVELGREMLEGIVQELLELPQVKESVAEEKNRVIEEYRIENREVTVQIAALKKQFDAVGQDLEKRKKANQIEIERMRKRSLQQEEELKVRMAAAFETASKSGMEVLTQASIYQAIFTGGKGIAHRSRDAIYDSHNTNKEMDSQRLSVPIPTQKGVVLASVRDIQKAFKKKVVNEGLSGSMFASVIASSVASPVIGLIGESTKNVIEAFAGIFANGVTCEISITGNMFGIHDLLQSPSIIRAEGNSLSTSLGTFLEHQQICGNFSVIHLRGINRAPPESFLPELMDLSLQGASFPGFCWTDDQRTARAIKIVAPVVFISTFVEGASTFPLEGSVLNLMPITQIGKDWTDSDPPESNDVSTLSSVTENVWKMLIGGQQEESVVSEDVPRLDDRFCSAAISLGFSKRHSDALCFLAMNIGRLPAIDIRKQIENNSAEFLPYANAVTSRESLRTLRYVFKNDEG